MIFPLAGMVLGALLGAVQAWWRGGKVYDMLQWGAVFALIFGLIGLFFVIIVLRNAA
jgi:hypothetical protein